MPRLIPATLAAVCLLLTACGDDPAEPVKRVPPSAYKDFSKEWHVLANLEQAYRDRNIDRYGQIFDADNFVFYFNPGDVGGTIPADWNHAAEIQCATHMFTGDPGADNNPILAIDLVLEDIEEENWTDLTDHPDFPGETLRQSVVVYAYFMDTALDVQYITSGAPEALFIVRNVGGQWKLVRWYDNPSGGPLRAAAGTEETNWSQVKGTYQ